VSAALELPFAKMEGAGNDFVVLEGAPPAREDLSALIVALCDRRRGVGADGALWMERLSGGAHVFRLHFFNSDGGRVNLCLNGARCVARRAIELGWAGASFRFRTELGDVEATEQGERIALRVKRPQLLRAQVAVPQGEGSLWTTGDPHLVLELQEEAFAQLDVARDGAQLRRWPTLGDEGANVHFVRKETPERWQIRSFERGVEGETLACGSGCISAFAALGGDLARAELWTSGGDRIELEADGDELRLSGPARTVFESVYRWVGP